MALTNVEEPPGEPPGLDGVGGLIDEPGRVAWTAPGDAGARLDGYGVQYRASGETRWTDHPHSGTVTRTDDRGPAGGHNLRSAGAGAGRRRQRMGGRRRDAPSVAAPAVAGALPDLTLVAGAVRGGGGRHRRVHGPGTGLTFTLPATPAVASFGGSDTVTANPGEAARLRGESAGEARITVTATNPGGSASVTFAVTVKAISDEEAEALGLSLWTG